eukprot:jgi/Chlat1/7352/Chrsp59S06958
MRGGYGAKRPLFSGGEGVGGGRRELQQQVIRTPIFRGDRSLLPMFRRRQQETVGERVFRYRGVMLVSLIPLLLVGLVVALMPRSGTLPSRFNTLSTKTKAVTKEATNISPIAEGEVIDRYGVIFDAGSTGSRVHVFRFDSSMSLKEIGGALELFEQVKPGLSSFEPKEAADSLRPLLDKAVEAVPEDQRAATKIALRATAGLRLLPGDKAEDILKEVRNLFKEYPFDFSDDSVSILDGADEGAFAWVTVNFLLGRLGGSFENTVGVVDLGGGSVQITHAVSDEAAAAAPDGYIRKLSGNGKQYNVYVHSYLGYGLMAARAAVLAEHAETDGHACLPKGFQGNYTYANKLYKAISRSVGSTFKDCTSIALAALHVEKACEVKEACMFNGVWGPKVTPTAQFYLASYFSDRATVVGIKDADDPTSSAAVADFVQAAEKACLLGLEDVIKEYPTLDSADVPFLCLDLAYIHALITKGFKLNAEAPFTLVKRIIYHEKEVEAAWPLGAVINDLSHIS